LAEEVARSDNPLTARVFVNRVWGWHFGEASGSADQKIRALYQLLYQREPEADELKSAGAFLRRPVQPPVPVVPTGWQYGYGTVKAESGQVVDFELMKTRQDFARSAPAPMPMTRWKEFAQVLLLSNEMALID